jgi:cell division protein FtsW (lipid II flippase)
MIVLGAILLIIGFIADISILWTIGLVLIVVGAVLALLGRTGRKVGGTDPASRGTRLPSDRVEERGPIGWQPRA